MGGSYVQVCKTGQTKPADPKISRTQPPLTEAADIRQLG